MRVIDPGHEYEVDVYDGTASTGSRITFMKRKGGGYPGNVDSYPGTNCQEVIRVLIDRVNYLDSQIPCINNKIIVTRLRQALMEFEIRAAQRHGRDIPKFDEDIERMPHCVICGYIGCHHTLERTRPRER